MAVGPNLLIQYKGYADILTAVILTVWPNLIYHSPPARMIAAATGLHLSQAQTAPGFNQAIACMVLAIGVGHVVAARRGGAGALPGIFAMNLTWALAGFVACSLSSERGSATLFMSSLNHSVFCAFMYISNPKVAKW